MTPYENKIHFKTSGIYGTSFTVSTVLKRPKIKQTYTVLIQTEVFLTEEEEKAGGISCCLTFDPKNSKLYYADLRVNIITSEVKLNEESYAKQKRSKKVL